MPEDNTPDNPDRTPTEVARDAMAAAQAVVNKSEYDLGAVVTITVPPDYNQVRYISNLPEDGVVSLLRATADQVEQRSNGNGPAERGGGNIQTP